MKKTILFIFLIYVSGSFIIAQDEPSEKKVMNPALLVIDVQKEYMPMMSQEDQESAIEMMNWSIWVFRKFNLPIIRVYHTSAEWGPAPDSPGFAFHDSLKVTEEDPMIIKTYGSSFTKTDLDQKIKELGVNTLFLCGLSATGCVLATYMDAGSHDYKAFMIKDALLSNNADNTNSVEDIFGAIGLETVMYMIEISRE